MRQLAALVALLGLLVAAPASAAQERRSVGVARFEEVAAAGQAVPEVGSRVAQRLATRGLARVVGPAELGAEAKLDAAPAQVAGWAAAAGVQAVVLGRTTRLGKTLSLDVRVLDGKSGQPLGPPLVEEADRPEDLGRAIEAVTAQVMTRLGADAPAEPGAAADPVAAGPDGAQGSAPPAAPASAGQAAPAAEEPISIRADQLEAVNHAGGKHLQFSGNVHVVQGALQVDSDDLDAIYPPGRSSPEKLVANGNVRIVQEGRVAHCTTADFFRDEKRVVCHGDPAILVQSCDKVGGKRITFHLDTELLEVDGGADVQIHQGEGCEP